MEWNLNSLSDKSKKKYESVFKIFEDWRALREDVKISEDLLLVYFNELSQSYTSSSLWAYYSMLRSMININYGMNIETFKKLREFLKCKSKDYVPKKSKKFTKEDINSFLFEAPDERYLATKVALILGTTGACTAQELHGLTIHDIQDLGSAMLVTVPESKKKSDRQFTVTGHYYELCRAYSDLRPHNALSTSFFLNYQQGKCTVQNIGINKFGTMGRQIAQFLKLPDPELYTGHCFRRSCGWKPHRQN